MKSINSMKKSIILTVILIVLGSCLYFLSRYNYNLFHITIEFFTIIIGILIFILTVLSRKYKVSTIIGRLGYGMLAVAFVTFLHMLSYKDMNIFSGYDSNLPTQLWIVLNYIQSICILSAILFLNVKIRNKIFLAVYMLSAIVLAYLCFARIFPDCFIEGEGLTPFKKISEYIIIIIYSISLALLFTKRKIEIRNTYKGLSFAIVAFIIAEFMFTLYSDVYGIQNFAGHYIRLIGMIIIYSNIVIINIQNPYNKIITDLTILRKEAEFNSAERMKELMAFYNLSKLTEMEGITWEKILREFTNVLPSSWQYPEITYARIAIGDIDFQTKNFKESIWKQFVPINIKGFKLAYLKLVTWKNGRKLMKGHS